VLLEFYDVRADQPVADDEGLVHGRSRTADQLLAGGIDGFEELCVSHGYTLSCHLFGAPAGTSAAWVPSCQWGTEA
jgi:hypothetical protein